MANHLTDVPSSDQHTENRVYGKLDFSPPVKDLVLRDFHSWEDVSIIWTTDPWRIGLPAPQAFINLFIWPSDSGSGQKP